MAGLNFKTGHKATNEIAMQPVKTPIWRELSSGIDWLSLRLAPVYRGAGVPHGDGSPVIVVPGCFASDASLRELHGWLSRIGYRPYNSGIGRNARCPDVSVEMLVETVDRAFAESGKKVTLVGHSLGGLLARGAAIQRPDAVARVITLGSPVNGVGAHPWIITAARSAGGDCQGECLGALQEPLPDSVRETCIFSPYDGVVDWRTTFRDDAEKIEVRATHTGLIFNSEVYEALADILAGESVAATETAIEVDSASLLVAA